jgi:hypothetical protein
VRTANGESDSKIKNLHSDTLGRGRFSYAGTLGRVCGALPSRKEFSSREAQNARVLPAPAYAMSFSACLAESPGALTNGVH